MGLKSLTYLLRLVNRHRTRFYLGKGFIRMTLVPEPEVGNMEDFFGEMTETEISKYKFNRVAKCLSIPPWQTAYA